MPKLMLKILQARLQQYVNWELQHVQVGVWRRSGTRDQTDMSTFVRSWRKQRRSRKTFNSASLTMLKLLTVWITTNWKILREMGIPDHFTSLYSNSQNQTWSNELVQNWERSTSRLYIVTLIIQHHAKCWAGWLTSWNQDCWEKYQQPQICRWYHPNGRNWRGTKETLDEGERGEWKSWLKTQH